MAWWRPAGSPTCAGPAPCINLRHGDAAVRGLLGVVTANFDLSVGGAVLLATLYASAFHIAAPAAMRIAVLKPTRRSRSARRWHHLSVQPAGRHSGLPLARHPAARCDLMTIQPTLRKLSPSSARQSSRTALLREFAHHGRDRLHHHRGRNTAPTAPATPPGRPAPTSASRSCAKSGSLWRSSKACRKSSTRTSAW